MPLAKSLTKVSKKIAGSSATLHAKGRKFKQLSRATEREAKIRAKKQRHMEQKNHELLFYLHIQESIQNRQEETFTMEDMREIVTLWVCRDDEELKEIDRNRRPGRPLTSKQQLLKEKRAHDEHVFETGIRTPDLRDKDTVINVRNWNGNVGASTAWKFTTVHKNPLAVPQTETDMS
uniref:Translation machinery-associated protein 16 n=1 Tax=Candidozyma auris TaxID=498019 RepID=A0A0L0NTV7_CANAR